MSTETNTRIFPVIESWTAVVTFRIPDDIPPEVFEKMVALAGSFIGLGRFRPERGGTNGRFKPVKFEWS